MRPTKDKYFIDMAVLVSSRGTCLRRKVGCVLVNKLGHVIATGYNGVASGLDHCNQEDDHYRYPNKCAGADSPSGTNLDACMALHGEQNALLQCNNVHDIDVAYVTAKPCITCMKLFMNTSCKRIVYLEDYPSEQTHILAEKAGISLWKYHD